MALAIVGFSLLFFYLLSKLEKSVKKNRDERITNMKVLLSNGADVDLVLRNEADIVVQVTIDSHAQKLKEFRQSKIDLEILNDLYKDSLDISKLKVIQRETGEPAYSDIERHIVVSSIIDRAEDSKLELHARYKHQCSDKAIVAMVINELIEQASELIQEVSNDPDFSPAN